MLKRWFDFSSNGNGPSGGGEHRNGAAPVAAPSSQPQESAGPPRPSAFHQIQEDCAERLEPGADFAQIYKRAGVPAHGPCGILKVVEMVQSPHLLGLSPEAKRCALLMALEAVGASVEGVLQDGVARQGVLNDYEKEQQEKLRRFEETKAEENRRLQAELDKLTHDYMVRMQAALDDVSREQDKFRAWQKRKQQELQKIAEAAALCVPESMGSQAVGLTTVLERACMARA